MATVPFMIQISDHKLEHLKQKLALADFPDRGPANSKDLWRRGVPVAEIHRLATVWRISYDWRKVEAQLNTFPQYRTTVNVKGFGLYEIHHIHMRSSRTDAIPLLFLHSWPGSFLEVTKMLKDLVQGPSDSVAFHVVAPSLIDFGFSSGNSAVRYLYDVDYERSLMP
jgi:pimeloyl-ACP methyl ester carboxylesterase